MTLSEIVRMDDPSRRRSKLIVAISWTALLLALASIGFAAWYIPIDRRRYIAIFRDFGMKLPRSTEMMMSVPDIAFPVAAAVIAVLMLGVQFVARGRSGAAVFHLLVITLSCVVFVLYRESLFQPLSMLMHGMSSGAPGR